ncbi:MAG: membrane lipoprotein lipid attachment site-containing protein [Bacteroidales bacterium]|nr:membrane lipoprotein lipid attachment site-containing protein [Bacteroidales bacterium]
MKRYVFLILAVALLAGGCQRQPIDKQEADAIVTQYIKKNFKADDRTERVVCYYNKLEEERIELSFLSEEDIVAENAFVYYIDEMFGAYGPHPFRIILVQKENGKHTAYQRSSYPSVAGDNWSLLFYFANDQFWRN